MRPRIVASSVEEMDRSSNERSEGTEEWVLGPLHPRLLEAATHLLVGDCGAAEEVISKRSESEKIVTAESHRLTKNDVALFAQRGRQVDHSLSTTKNDWIGARDAYKTVSFIPVPAWLSP